MKVKASITLSEDILAAVDRVGENRSQVIEAAIRMYLEARARATRDAKDVERINRRADALNRELADALEYQDA